MTLWSAALAEWTTRQRAGLALFALGLVGSALALGAVHPPVLMATAVVLATACGLLWWDAPPSKPRRSATILVLVSASLIAYTLLQAVPLPAALAHVLDARSDDVWSRALSPLREAGPAWHPLSLDPVATHFEALRGVAYACAFLAAIRIAARREGTQLLSALLVVSSLVLAIASLLHPAFGARRVFGVYTPETVIDERHLSPILNPNPLAAYLNVGLTIATAAALSPRPVVPRPISAAAAIVLLATQFWVASRGGIVSMVLAIAIVVLMMRAATAHRRPVPMSGVVYGAMAIAGVGMMVLASSKEAWDELAGTDASKLTMQKQILPLVWAHKWFGVGRGAFESSFPAFRRGTGHMLFTHPEHVVIQWVSEWGVPVAFVALGAIAWALRRESVTSRSHVVIGAWAALAGGAVHNLVDLNSEVPAVMLAFVSCAALVVAGNGGGAAFSKVDAWAHHPRAVAVAAASTAFALAALCLPIVGKDLYADRRMLRDLAKSGISDDAFLDAARDSMLRHPAEPYLPFVGALRASARRDLDAIPWAAATIERAPVYGPVHMVLGRTLRSLSPAQARLEYRLALSQAPELIGYVLRDAVPLIANYDDALEIVPDVHAEVVLANLAPVVAMRMPATQTLLDGDVLRRDASALDSMLRIARANVAALTQHEPWCEPDPKPCLDAALESAQRLISHAPSRCEGYALRARAVAAAGDAGAAAEQLSTAIQSVDDPGRCLTVLVQIASAGKLDARLSNALDRLARAPCASPAQCVENLVSAGEAEAQRHRLERALVLFRKAHDRAPDDDSILERVASTTSALGLHAESMEAYARLGKRHPTEERYRRLMLLEQEAIGGVPRFPR